MCRGIGVTEKLNITASSKLTINNEKLKPNRLNEPKKPGKYGAAEAEKREKTNKVLGNGCSFIRFLSSSSMLSVPSLIHCQRSRTYTAYS